MSSHPDTAPAAAIPVPQTINVKDITLLTARLAQVLAHEADLMASMELKEVQSLQQEKLFLTGALDSHRKTLARHPHLLETIPSQDRQDLQGVVEVFNDILKENHRRLLIAREVNRKVVDTITQVVKENSRSAVYGMAGMQGAMGSQSISITLNQTA